MKRKSKLGNSSDDAGGMNMTPMIDIVFQMIIFFVCTVQLEKDAVNEKIRLEMAPHGPAVQEKNPYTVTVDLDEHGGISIAKMRMSDSTFRAILKKTIGEFGHTVPVVIRGDIATQHKDIKRVMDSCSQVGVWKIKFAAIKDKVEK